MGKWGECGPRQVGRKTRRAEDFEFDLSLSAPVLSRAVDVDYRLIWVAPFRRFAHSPSRPFEALAQRSLCVIFHVSWKTNMELIVANF